MSTGTKMIILTSDEDLIHKLSSTQNSTTYLIDLNEQKQTNPVNAGFFAELSQIVRT